MSAGADTHPAVNGSNADVAGNSNAFRHRRRDHSLGLRRLVLDVLTRGERILLVEILSYKGA
jgi:hypothetical protein